MNIIVLAGGYSAERDVSLVSGSQAAMALQGRGHAVLLLDPYRSIERHDSFQGLFEAYRQDSFGYAISKTEPDLAALKQAIGNGEDLLGENVLQACKLADVVFIGLHGSYGENGQVQAAFDLFDICYTGSGYIGCMLSMDKAVAKELMAAHGVQVPRSEELFIGDMSPAEFREALAHRKLPVVVKPCNGGSSIGVTIVKTEADIDKAIAYAQVQEDRVLAEDYIAGREFSVGVLDGHALPVIEICPKSGFFDYANKYQANATNEICPASIPEDLAGKMQAAALQAHRALRLGDYSRVDFIADHQGEIYCLEANSLPGMAPASLLPKEALAAGIPYEDLCERIVQLAVNRKKGF